MYSSVLPLDTVGALVLYSGNIPFMPDTKFSHSLESSSARIGFGRFELDRNRGLLFRNGAEVKLQAQPMAILIALVDRAGKDVGREELQKLVWPEGTFIEFESGIATAIRKIRVALGDSAEKPVYIRTLHGRGFRFIAPVHLIATRMAAAPMEHLGEPAGHPLPVPPRQTAPERPPAENAVPVTIVSPPRRRIPWLGIAAAIAISAATWLGSYLLRSKPSPDPVRFAIEMPPGQKFEYYAGRRIAISPDGRLLAYIAALNGIRRIFLKRMDETEIRPLPNTDNASSMCFSPAGDWIAFLANGELRKTSVDGRRVAKIISLSPSTDSGRFIWQADNQIYFSASHFRLNARSIELNIFRVPAQGGEATPVLYGLEPASSWHYPQQLLEGGKDLLFATSWSPVDRAVNLWNFDTGKAQQLIEHASGGEFVPPGHIVFARSGNLMAASFDLASKRVTGNAVMMAPDVAVDRYSGLQAGISRTGTLVYVRSTLVKQSLPVWVDMQGNEMPSNLPAARYRLLDLSRDGKKVLLARFDAGDQWSIWSWQTDTSEWKELLTGDSPGVGGIFAPDGQSVAISTTARGEHFDNLYLRSLSGNAPDRQLTPETEEGRYPQGWSAAANAIVFTQGYNSATKQDIYVQSLAPGAKPRCFSCTVDHDILPSFSPDGQWIAYTISGVERSDIYAQRYPGPGPVLRVSPDGGSNSLWAPNGQEVYYRRGSEMWAVPFHPAQGAPGRARRLFSAQFAVADSSWNRDMALSPDGKRFLILKALPESPDSHRIQVVLNWSEELKRAVR